MSESPHTATSPRHWRGQGLLALTAAALASAGTYTVITFGPAASLSAHQEDAPSATAMTSQVVNAMAKPSPADLVKASAEVSATGWATVARSVSPSVVAISMQSASGSGQGSGVIIDDSGRVLTNNHVAVGAGSGARLRVTLNDGRSYAATILGTDPSTDLAVLAITDAPKDLSPITFGDSGGLAVGDPVMAVGNPLGLAGTVTTGIISALNRPVTTTAATENERSPYSRNATPAEAVVTNAIQTSAAINPGNSGGALVNAKGELIGINSSIAQLGQGSSSGNIGIGFAIPAKEAASIATQLISNGSAQHAYLGVGTKDSTVKDGAAERAAAQVVQVTANSPAARAGITIGDTITAVGGERVESAQSLIAHIRELTVNDETTLTVVRDGSARNVKVTLTARPGQSG